MIAAAIGITPVSTEGQEFCASGTPICTRLETVKTKPLKAEKIKKEKKVKKESDKSDKSGSDKDGRRNLSHNSSSESSTSSESSDSSGSDSSGGVIFDCCDAELDQPACFDICAAQDFVLELEG